MLTVGGLLLGAVLTAPVAASGAAPTDPFAPTEGRFTAAQSDAALALRDPFAPEPAHLRAAATHLRPARPSDSDLRDPFAAASGRRSSPPVPATLPTSASSIAAEPTTAATTTAEPTTTAATTTAATTAPMTATTTTATTTAPTTIAAPPTAAPRRRVALSPLDSPSGPAPDLRAPFDPSTRVTAPTRSPALRDPFQR